MNELAATSFPAALRAAMEAGCGKDIEFHGHAKRWGQAELATELDISDRLVRKWLKGDVAPGDDHFCVLVALMAPKDCPRQRAAYEQLKASRPAQSVTRKPRRPSAAAASKTLEPIPLDASPYRGLEPFREGDARLFFGRDALAQKVLDKLDHHRLVLVMGASGSGKSSLINAGILPKLRTDPTHTIVHCTPGGCAITNLAAALVRDLHPDLPPSERLQTVAAYQEQILRDPDAIRTIAQFLPGKCLFLVIDQFEESFTLTRPANPKQHEALIATLLAIARSPEERRLNALLGMRSDFLNELETADPELIQRLDNASVQMRAMFPAELEAAITGPLQPYNVTLEPGLLPAIAADLKGNADALPLVEVALEELWQQRDDSKRRLTKAAYAEIGGITGALGQRADGALAHLGLDETLVRRLFLELVRVESDGAGTKTTRRPRTRDELGDDLWLLGQKLTARRLRFLVTSRDEATGTEILDVTHEAIFRQWRRLAGWIEEERDFLLFTQRLDQRLAEFIASGENPDYLLPKTDVDAAQAWQNDGKTFSTEQQAYIARSTAFWAQDTADDAARALWARLELSFEKWRGIPEHDRFALTGLWTANLDTIQRFIVLATIDRDSARKFNRQPALILRAALGLDSATAIARAAPALQNSSAAPIHESGFTWLTLASHLAPITAIDATRIVAYALDLARQTTSPPTLRALAQAIAAAAANLDRETARDAAGRLVARALDLADQTTDQFLLLDLTKAIAAITDKLDPETISAAADHTVARALDLADQSEFEPYHRILTETVAQLADKLDPGAADRTVARTLELAGKSTSPATLQALAQSIVAMANKLDPEAAKRTVARALDIASQTANPDQLQALAQVIAVMADKLDPETIRGAAGFTTFRVIDLAGQATNIFELTALTNSIPVLVDKLDPETAGGAVARALDLAGQTTSVFKVAALIQTIEAMADKLEHEVVGSTAARVLDLADHASHPLQLLTLAETMALRSESLDREAAKHSLGRLLGLVNQTTYPPALQALTRAIVSMADKLDTEAIGEAAGAIVTRALYFAGQEPIYSDQIGTLTQTITSIASKLEAAAAKRTFARVIDLAGQTTDQYRLQALAEAITAVGENLDSETMREAGGFFVTRALELIGQTTFPYQTQALSQTIAAMVDTLDPQTADRAVAHAFDLTARTIHPDQLQALSQSIASLVDKLDSDAACSTVARALDLAGQTTSPSTLRVLAQTIASMADKLGAERIRDAAGHLVSRALKLADQTIDPNELKALAQAIYALTPHLGPVVVGAAIELLKHPLGGDEQVTDTLLRTITTALDRPYLLRPFPEQSFWAVMQHLAKLKAANPDWDWLDLARPPLPPHELITTFRRLCADPPAPAQAQAQA